MCFLKDSCSYFVVDMSDIQKCGFCGVFARYLRRIMCSRNRRGSSESCYRELDDQDALRFDRRSETSSDSPSFEDRDFDYNEAPVDKLQDKNETPDDELQDYYETPDDKLERKTSLRKFDGILHEDAKEILNINWNKRGPGLSHSFRKKPRRSLTSSSKFEEVILDNCYPLHVQIWLSRSSYWDFDTASFDRATGGQCLPSLGIHLFAGYGLFEFFKLLPERCWKLFRSIEDCYHATNPYHNSVHAADVTQAVHCFLQEPLLSRNLSRLEVMVVLLAAITHDLDHPGVNHSFLVATDHPLAIMFKDERLGSQDRSPLPRCEKRERPCESLLEHHHWRVAYSVILESGIFDHMKEALPEIKKMLRSLILATDITRQNEYLTVFKDHLKHHTLNMERADHRHMVLQMALKTADISNPGRPWAISKKWSYKVCDEFYQQGDQEIKLNLKVSNLCNRERDTIPKIQTGFFRFVVTPLFTEWHHYLRSKLSLRMLTNLVHNEAEWAREERRSSQASASRSATDSDLWKISDADQVEDDLVSSTYRSKSTMSFATDELRAYLIEQSGRRASNSPMKESMLREIFRRHSMPLHFGLRDAASKVSSLLELPFKMAKQSAKLRAEAATAASAVAAAFAGPSYAPVTPPLHIVEPLDKPPRRALVGYAVQLDSDDDDDDEDDKTSSDEKGGPGVSSVIIEESSLSSGSVPNGGALSSGSARIGLLSPQTASASNSEGHLNKKFEEDASREKGGLRALSGRRGSAPAVGALAARLVVELSHQLHLKHSVSCQQWVSPETPVKGARRGSLPAVKMTGIST